MPEPIKPTYYPGGPPAYVPPNRVIGQPPDPAFLGGLPTMPRPQAPSTLGANAPGVPVPFPAVPAGPTSLGGFDMGRLLQQGLGMSPDPFFNSQNPARLTNPLWVDVPNPWTQGGRGMPVAWYNNYYTKPPTPEPAYMVQGSSFRPLPGGGGVWNPPMTYTGPISDPRPVIVPGDIDFLFRTNIPPGTVMQPGQGVPVMSFPATKNGPAVTVTAPAGTKFQPLRPSQVFPFTPPPAATPPASPVVTVGAVPAASLPQYQNQMTQGDYAVQRVQALNTAFNGPPAYPNFPGGVGLGWVQEIPRPGDPPSRPLLNPSGRPIGQYPDYRPGWVGSAVGNVGDIFGLGARWPVLKNAGLLDNAGPLAPDDGGFSGAAFGGTGSFGGGGGSIGVVANPPVSP